VKRQLLLIGVAAVLVLGTLALPVTIDQPADLLRVRHGAPLPYVWQNLAELVPMGHTSFPFRTAVVSPWEYPTEWSLPALLLNLALVWGGLRLIVAAWGRPAGGVAFCRPAAGWSDNPRSGSDRHGQLVERHRQPPGQRLFHRQLVMPRRTFCTNLCPASITLALR
jgi:hypothetical protein